MRCRCGMLYAVYCMRLGVVSMDDQSSTCCTSLFTSPLREWPEYPFVNSCCWIYTYLEERGLRGIRDTCPIGNCFIRSNRDRYYNKIMTHLMLQCHVRLSVPELGASAVKTKTIQHVAVCERLTEDVGPSEDDVVRAKVSWTVFCKR
jgi:hypothetical protein